MDTDAGKERWGSVRASAAAISIASVGYCLVSVWLRCLRCLHFPGHKSLQKAVPLTRM